MPLPPWTKNIAAVLASLSLGLASPARAAPPAAQSVEVPAPSQILVHFAFARADDAEIAASYVRFFRVHHAFLEEPADAAQDSVRVASGRDASRLLALLRARGGVVDYHLKAGIYPDLPFSSFGASLRSSSVLGLKELSMCAAFQSHEDANMGMGVSIQIVPGDWPVPYGMAQPVRFGSGETPATEAIEPFLTVSIAPEKLSVIHSDETIALVDRLPDSQGNGHYDFVTFVTPMYSSETTASDGR